MDISPAYFLISALMIAVVFVNGWTDAPNAIATCVSTGCLSMKKAVLMAAIFNLAGVVMMTLLFPQVADTMQELVILSPDDPSSIITLCAALFSIVLWAVIAWWFGIPTSESHGLIAGITGAALASGGLKSVNLSQWSKVFMGLFLSVLMGFLLGAFFTGIISFLFRRTSERTADSIYTTGQIASSAAMAFMHGAQDGQKFIGIFVLGSVLSGVTMEGSGIPLWIMILCAGVMGLGTAMGGKRIIKSVGEDMVSLQKAQGFGSDLGAAAALFILTLMGVPVSTTHTKTTAVMGAGFMGEKAQINRKIIAGMFMAWGGTFPFCGLIAYMITKTALFFL